MRITVPSRHSDHRDGLEGEHSSLCDARDARCPALLLQERKKLESIANLFIGGIVFERVQAGCCWRWWSREVVLDYPVDTEPFRR